MRLLFDGQQFQVKFAHIPFEIKEDDLQRFEAGEPVVSHITRCEILLAADDGTFNKVAEDLAACSLLDNFNRRRGRMISLGRALMGLWPQDQARRKRFVRAVRLGEKTT